MPITLTISANSADELIAEVKRITASGETAPAVYDVSSDNTAEQSTTAAPGKPPRAGRKPKSEVTPAAPPPTEPQQAISTDDERDDPSAKAQDAADEKAPEQLTEETPVLTLDDVRHAATPYIRKHTMAAAQSDLQDCLFEAVGVRKISELTPTDQTMLKKAVEAFDTAGKADTRFVKAA